MSFTKGEFIHPVEVHHMSAIRESRPVAIMVVEIVHACSGSAVRNAAFGFQVLGKRVVEVERQSVRKTLVHAQKRSVVIVPTPKGGRKRPPNLSIVYRLTTKRDQRRINPVRIQPEVLDKSYDEVGGM